MRAFIIEDNASYAELLKEMLAENEIASERAGTLEEGIRRLVSEKFDVVVLDLGLPDAEGHSSCERLRTKFPALPIVIVSGYSEQEAFAMQYLQMGAQDYLQKGFFDGKLLGRSLRYASQRKMIETEYRKAQEALLESNQRLTEKLGELDRLNMLMMGREERILELKEELKSLQARLQKQGRGSP